MRCFAMAIGLLGSLLLPACAATAPDGEPPVAEVRDPIVGGVSDVFRSYVVGVGGPYDPSHPGYPGTGPWCSGTLISRRTVLTAAHCQIPSAGPPEPLTAVFFGPSIGDPLPASATVVAVDQVVIHPGFDAATLTHDLALLHLAADPPSQAVPLLRETLENTPSFVGPAFTFVGYGNDGESAYDTRRVAVFPIAAVGPACVGQDTHTGPIDATQIYYRVAGKNTCDGDSGGPAFLARSGVERLAGATSSGDATCVVDGSDARTDLPQIEAFIQPTIDLMEKMDPCRADGICNETCNTGGVLVDPDCAPYHCGADGVCALSCVDPPDPDCPKVDHCPADGVCDPACSPADPDCSAPPDAGAPALADAGVCPRDAGAPADAGTDAGGSDESGDADPFDCGCGVPGGPVQGGGPVGVLLLGAIWAAARRRSAPPPG